jgi:CheY-like chemotaxis protein
MEDQMSDARSAARGRVLVIDDDADTLATASCLLERSGFEVVTFNGCFNRLAFVVAQQPDLVLMDVNMPLVPGDDLCRLMKDQEDLRDIPVVYFSSNDERTLHSLARATGAAGYIAKSDMAMDLGAKVARFLRSSRTTAPERTGEL